MAAPTPGNCTLMATHDRGRYRRCTCRCGRADRAGRPDGRTRPPARRRALRARFGRRGWAPSAPRRLAAWRGRLGLVRQALDDEADELTTFDQHGRLHLAELLATSSAVRIANWLVRGPPVRLAGARSLAGLCAGVAGGVAIGDFPHRVVYHQLITRAAGGRPLRSSDAQVIPPAATAATCADGAGGPRVAGGSSSL